MCTFYKRMKIFNQQKRSKTHLCVKYKVNMLWKSNYENGITCSSSLCSRLTSQNMILMDWKKI